MLHCKTLQPHVPKNKRWYSDVCACRSHQCYMWNTFPSSDGNKAPNYELAKKSVADAEQVVAQLSRATITYVSCAFIFCYSRLRHARITHALNFD